MKAITNTRTIYITEADMRRLTPFIETLKNSRDDIHALQTELDLANVVPPAEIPADVITMNSRARLRDLDTGE
jgi:regulator of nucleoside diphosphate kinase